MTTAKVQKVEELTQEIKERIAALHDLCQELNHQQYIYVPNTDVEFSVGESWENSDSWYDSGC